MELTTALQQFAAQMILYVIPLVIAAILSYGTVCLFYRFGPLSSMRAKAGSDLGHAFDENGHSLGWK